MLLEILFTTIFMASLVLLSCRQVASIPQALRFLIVVDFEDHLQLVQILVQLTEYSNPGQQRRLAGSLRYAGRQNVTVFLVMQLQLALQQIDHLFPAECADLQSRHVQLLRLVLELEHVRYVRLQHEVLDAPLVLHKASERSLHVDDLVQTFDQLLLMRTLCGQYPFVWLDSGAGDRRLGEDRMSWEAKFRLTRF